MAQQQFCFFAAYLIMFKTTLGAVEQRGYSAAGDLVWRKVPTSPTAASDSLRYNAATAGAVR